MLDLLFASMLSTDGIQQQLSTIFRVNNMKGITQTIQTVNAGNRAK